jgi:hypothetical protein
VRAIVTIALLAQWGGQGHTAGRAMAMGSIPKNVKKNTSPEFFTPYRNDKGKFLGYMFL